MLKSFRFANQSFGILVGAEKVIILENDCCHQVLKLDESFSAWNYSEGEYETIKVSEIIAEETTFQKFVNYWGIKPRIQGNFNLLKKSIKEIGLELKLPDWSDKNM